MIGRIKPFITTMTLALLTAMLLGCSTPTPIPTPAPMPAPATLQNTVDAIALNRDLYIPKNLDPQWSDMSQDPVKTGEEFDVNEYFSVLTHLSMQQGYVLDYVYFFGGIGGEPVIYAREIDQAPYLTYSAYKDAGGDIDIPLRRSQRRAMEYIQVDGTAEGFFELIVFLIMGNQFYRYWHANYNDTIIICDYTGLEKVLAGMEAAVDMSGKHFSWPSGVKRKARKLDLQPVIEFKNDTVVVEVVTFTRWGGFIQKSYTISRDFPHSILEEKSKTLVKYEIDIVF